MATQLAASIARPSHGIGRKKIFLPNFTLTLLRTPKLPPTFATFLVPLSLNKLDIRDYLWHAYGLRINSVRSYVQIQKLRQDKPGVKRPSPRKWFRPRSIKKMTVEMERPFVWPEEPDMEGLSKWDKKTFDAAQEDRTEMENQFKQDFRQQPSKDRDSIAEQARRLLKGEDKWEPKQSQWEDVGEEVEVETDVILPKIER